MAVVFFHHLGVIPRRDLKKFDGFFHSVCTVVFYIKIMLDQNITHIHMYELKPNSWTYNFVEVSGHNLESSKT